MRGLTERTPGKRNEGAEKIIRVVSIEQTCSACPTQWEGLTSDGRVVYVRYRWGWLSIGVGGTLEEAVGERRYYGARLGGQWDGELEFDQLVEATQGVFEWPCKQAAGDETKEAC
jgi:hypothetical protein